MADKKPDGLLFHISAKELAASKKWMDSHPCKLRGKPLRAAIGQGATYTFTSTSIGEMRHVECSCGETELLNFEEL